MKNIILTGLMGAGKTSVAGVLKNIFPNFNLIETDVLIAEKEGLSINEIFSMKGENYFRFIEKNIINEILDKENQIISLGGGSLENDFDFNSAKKNSLIFYLEADVEILYKRIKNDKQRPLLKCENPQKKLKELLMKREKNYKKSDYIINVNSLDIESIAKKIKELYDRKNKS